MNNLDTFLKFETTLMESPDFFEDLNKYFNTNINYHKLAQHEVPRQLHLFVTGEVLQHYTAQRKLQGKLIFKDTKFASAFESKYAIFL